ncbi:MAG: PPC domain-containing protein [Chloroflexota bacterium]
MIHRARIVFLVSLCLLLIAPDFVRAQTTQPSNTIDFGQTVTGTITNDAFRVVYTFQGRKGDIIDVSLTNTDGTLDPVLILADDQNKLIASDDDSIPDFNAELVSEQLPRDSTYFLIVTRFGQERGLTTGSYSLTLSRVGITGDADTALHYGDSIVNEISTQQFQHIYAFRAIRGDIIQATMQRISGDLDSFLILADAAGNVLVSNDEDAESPGTLDAGIYNFRIEKSGNYLLVATRFGREAGESSGGFSLSLDRLSPERLGNIPERSILLDYGSVETGTIDADNVMRFYLIEAKKGDVLTINAERTRGNLDPTLTLYTSDLKELANNDSGLRGQNARISAYTVPVAGSYVLMVSRFNRDKGITAGDYSLSMVGRNGATVGANGKLTLQYGSAVSAIISDSSAEQQYTFAGTAGEVLSMNMAVTSGNLIAQLIFLDPAGKQIAQDDPGTGDAKLTTIKLTATGNYVIIATRRGRINGTTLGSYILTLTPKSQN